MKVMETKDVKVDLLKKCIEMQSNIVKNAKKAMDEAQESANDEGNTTEELSDSFRETMQNARDMFAKRYYDSLNNLELLKHIPVNENNKIEQGALVFTNIHNYYVSISLGAVQYEGNTYYAISEHSPIFKEMEGMKKGDEFTFRDKTIKIKDII
jgi:hypothetical protein